MNYRNMRNEMRIYDEMKLEMRRGEMKDDKWEIRDVKR